MATNALKTKHFSQFTDNLTEVSRILTIHTEVSGKGPGRKHDVEVLNKSSIVMIVACWEAFVEDLAGSALEQLIENSKDHSVVPHSVLERVASKNQGISSWKLAGDGWKSELTKHYKSVLEQTTGKLNTPRTKQIDELFLKTIGLESLSRVWYWPGRTATNSAKSLDRLITLRGEIAHRVSASRRVQKKEVRDSSLLVMRLAVKSHNTVSAHIRDLTGKAPWGRVRLGSVS